VFGRNQALQAGFLKSLAVELEGTAWGPGSAMHLPQIPRVTRHLWGPDIRVIPYLPHWSPSDWQCLGLSIEAFRDVTNKVRMCVRRLTAHDLLNRGEDGNLHLQTPLVGDGVVIEFSNGKLVPNFAGFGAHMRRHDLHLLLEECTR
jgi:hypothetical protein